MSYSYSLKKILIFVEKEGFYYKLSFSEFRNIGRYITGCYIYFQNSDIYLSVQTNPNICGSDFAQTALLSDKGLLYIPSLGYEKPLFHIEPEYLLLHIKLLKNILTGRNTLDFSDCKLQTYNGLVDPKRIRICDFKDKNQECLSIK